jgi:hypothetical protein
MRVIISSLAARYHINDGWNLEILNNYLITGRFVRSPNMDEDPYFILQAHSSLDVDRFLSDYPDVEIKSGFYGERGMTPRELLISRNW